MRKWRNVFQAVIYDFVGYFFILCEQNAIQTVEDVIIKLFTKGVNLINPVK